MLVSGRVVFFFWGGSKLLDFCHATFSFANADGWLMRAPCWRPEIVRPSWVMTSTFEYPTVYYVCATSWVHLIETFEPEALKNQLKHQQANKKYGQIRLSQQQHIATSMNVWRRTLYAQMIEYKKEQKRLFRVPWKNQFQVVLSTPIGYPGAGTSAREWGGHGPDHSQHGPVLLTCLCIKQFARHVGRKSAACNPWLSLQPGGHVSHIGQCAVDIACIYTILYQYVDNDSSQLAHVYFSSSNSLNHMDPFFFVIKQPVNPQEWWHFHTFSLGSQPLL